MAKRQFFEEADDVMGSKLENVVTQTILFSNSITNDLDPIAGALRSLREHLRMDLAFISEFAQDHRLFRYVDSILSFAPIQAGETMQMDEGYCRKIVDKELPQLIPDTALCIAALEIPATKELPIGAHISVPLTRVDGSLYGTLCCFSREPDRTLNQRDLSLMHAFAALIGQQISIDLQNKLDFDEKRHRISRIVSRDELRMVYQPIFRLDDKKLVGCEALARFDMMPTRTPDKWFIEAGEVGQRDVLECHAITNALTGFADGWDMPDLYISVNCSPQTIIQSRLQNLLNGFPLDRIILEITEHEKVEDYDALAVALIPLRAGGVRVAIDDAGSGFASMRHILNIEPDLIKLDVSLTRGINRDQKKAALAQAFVTFGRQIGSEIVAEGVETLEELDTLRSLGVDKAQGYLLGKPGALEKMIGAAPMN